MKIPPFEKARTVLEALKQQEQERRKKVGNRWEQAVLSQLGIALVCPRLSPGSLLPSVQGATLS